MKEETVRSTLVFVVVLAVLISAGVYLAGYIDEHFLSRFRRVSPATDRSLPVQRPSPVKEKSHAAETTTLSNTVDAFGYPLERADKLQLISLLRSRNFKELNDLLESYQKQFEMDFRYEFKVTFAFDSFSMKDSSIKPMLDEWVQEFPESFAPYLARSEYLSAKGWESRGGSYASETSEEQFAGMTEYFIQAEKDFRTALRLRAKLVSAYGSLIDIYKAYGNEKEVDLLAQEALNKMPESYLVRSFYMQSLMPRWGGSHEDMDTFAVESEKLAGVNPRFRVLRGFVYWDQAKYLRKEKKNEDAIRLLDQALQYGESVIVLRDRGKAQLSMKRYKEAFEDFDRCLMVDPQQAEVLWVRAEALSALGRVNEALQDLDLAGKLKPGEPNLVESRRRASHHRLAVGYELYRQKKQAEALGIFEEAITIDPGYYQTYYWRASIYVETRQWDLAQKDLERSIALDPKHLESYQLIDWVLIQRREYDKIIALWDKYLTLVPGDAQAYLERAGTKYHKKDYLSSAEDAQKACDLGKQEGCKLYQDLQKEGKIKS